MGIDRKRYRTIREAAKDSGYEYEYLRKLVTRGIVKSLEISERVRLVDYEDLLRYRSERKNRGPHSDSKSQRDT